jgi:acyl carrier protein
LEEATMAIAREEIDGKVQEAVAAALGVDNEEATPDATLMGDLGAESIDLLDILFRIERSTKVKIQAADLAAHIQGGIPDEEFGDADGVITDKGLAQLKKAMPQIDPDALRGNLQAEKVITLFTVQNLADMVAERAEAGAS